MSHCFQNQYFEQISTPSFTWCRLQTFINGFHGSLTMQAFTVIWSTRCIWFFIMLIFWKFVDQNYFLTSDNQYLDEFQDNQFPTNWKVSHRNWSQISITSSKLFVWSIPWNKLYMPEWRMTFNWSAENDFHWTFE